MNRRNKKPAPAKRGAPAYLVTMGDLMTNMLVFFILLYSYSTDRKLGFVMERVKAFNTVIQNYGLPSLLPGAEDVVILEDAQPGFAAFPKNDEGKISNITSASHLPMLKGVQVTEFAQGPGSLLVVPFPFAPGESRLSLEQQQHLRTLLPLLRRQSLLIEIEGYAVEEKNTPAEELQLAMQRAIQAVTFLQQEGRIPLARLQAVGHRVDRKQSKELFGRVIVLRSTSPS